MTEPLYTLAQARKIGLREVCASEGHKIERNHGENGAGMTVWNFYACEVCDVTITLTYPTLE